MRKSESHEIVIDGPTRCSKTMFILDFIFDLCFKNPDAKMRIAIVRANAVDHSLTIRNDIANTLLRYHLQDKRFKGVIEVGGGKAFTDLVVNGNFITLAGMNNPAKILGSEFDIIFNSQVEQLKKDQYEILLTRCGGTSGKWIENGRVRSLIISDANPDRKDHFLLLRKQKRQTEFINFNFKDNPLFFRDGEWTQIGIDYRRTLEQGLTGVNYDRYFLGEWTSPEGAVFILKDEHVVETLPWRRTYSDPDFDEVLDDATKNPKYSIPPSTQYNVYRMMDFGSTAPSVCLWLAEHKKTKDAIVFQEWRKTQVDTLAMADEVRKYNIGKPRRTIIDNDDNIRKILAKCGISAMLAPKGHDSVKAGIDMIQEALRRTSEGRDGGLQFYRGLQCNEDPELEKKGLSLDVINEMGGYVWDETRDAPLKGQSDHGIDPLRYYYLNKNQYGSRVKYAQKVDVKQPGWL